MYFSCWSEIIYGLLGNRKYGFRKFNHRKYCHRKNGHRKKVEAPYFLILNLFIVLTPDEKWDFLFYKEKWLQKERRKRVGEKKLIHFDSFFSLLRFFFLKLFPLQLVTFFTFSREEKKSPLSAFFDHFFQTKRKLCFHFC